MSVITTGTLNAKESFRPMPGVKWIIAAITFALTTVPQAISDTFVALTVLIALDTFSGLVVAAKCKQIRSKKMREQLSAKLTQYALILGLGGCVGFVAHQWTIVGAGLGACMSIEIVSVLENVMRLEKCGGAPLGPARPFLLKVARFFAVSNETEKVDEDEPSI